MAKRLPAILLLPAPGAPCAVTQPGEELTGTYPPGLVSSSWHAVTGTSQLLQQQPPPIARPREPLVRPRRRLPPSHPHPGSSETETATETWRHKVWSHDPNTDDSTPPTHHCCPTTSSMTC
ncbi:hypothetical protein K456DRAFT_43591 [Colletotrichum gloeosporioides 23]|nr:hypothetical protein K456DRAFT_43591 [Colletotrichum gloeosporioides 23]